MAEDLFRAEEAAADCDLLLAVGSTLAVFPAAGLVPVAVRHGAVAIIVNGGPTEMDALADVVVDGPDQRVPAGAGGGADALFFSVVIPPLPLALRRGFSANHQMLAIVPSVTAAAATGLTTLRARSWPWRHLTRRAWTAGTGVTHGSGAGDARRSGRDDRGGGRSQHSRPRTDRSSM